MPVFDYSFTVDASLDAVHEFHHDTSALKILTPPPTVVQLHRIELLAEGSVSDFTLWIGPIPIRWKAVHRDITENGFTDIQAEGPAAMWEHTHTFTRESEGKTRVSEHIEFEHKPSWRGLLTRALFARPNLLAMFTYRKLATRRYVTRSSNNRS